jgi:hypothetical protein
MSKSNYFFGQSVFGQLISLIEPSIVKNAVKIHKSDYYTKKFTTQDHLISMLFACTGNCNSLREVSAAMLGLKGKTDHFMLKNIPYKSTLSDANNRRSHETFGEIYFSLLNHYRSFLSDSRYQYQWESKLEIIDSTTIPLFKDILSCVGRTPKSGKRKGGIKVHTQINMNEKLPKLLCFTAATTHDSYFLNKLILEKGKIAVFDKGYNDYVQFDEFSKEGIFFVTRIKSNASYTTLEEHEIPDYIEPGVLKDEKISLDIKEKGKIVRQIELRRVAFWDDENQRCFEFLTNLHGMNAGHIALIYKQRWKIELLFKQLKQNFPLKYFLGESENAIKIQIWCTLIVNLLYSVIHKTLTRKWAFSRIVSFCRLHLFNYIHLLKFLENPEADWLKEKSNEEPNLFSQNTS